MEKNRNAYQTEYKRVHYDRIVVELPKGKRDVLKEYATARGISVAALTVRALEEYTGMDLSTKD